MAILFTEFMILILHILDLENRKQKKTKKSIAYNLFISFQHINFYINFNTQISKCSMRINLRKIFKISTAVEQAVACAPVTQRAGFDPRSGQVS